MKSFKQFRAQHQGSTSDQLKELHGLMKKHGIKKNEYSKLHSLANKHGLYDAADVYRTKAESKQKTGLT